MAPSVTIRLPLASSISEHRYPYLSAGTETWWVSERSRSSPGFVAEASRRQNEKPVGQMGKTDFLCGTEGQGQPRAGPVWRPGSPAPRAAVGQEPCRVHSTGPGWPKTQLGHETGSSGSCRRDGTGGLGRVCCSRLAGRRQKPEQAEGVQLVNAIYTMYKLVNQSARLAASSTGPGASAGRWAPVGRAGSSNTFLALKGKGEEVPMAPPGTKNVERIL